MLASRYQIRVNDVLGAQVAVLDLWRNLKYRHAINGAEDFALTLSGKDDRIPLFTTDGEVEVWRCIPGKLDWYREWKGLVEDSYDVLAENGDWEYTITGCGLKGLLSRRCVEWHSGTAQADKADVAETVIKAYVNENFGAGATVAAGRFSDGLMVELSVEVDSARGDYWEGQRSGRNVLETIQEIANYSSLGFDMVETSARAWEFRIYTDQPGVDRTNVGLDPATGLNAAGNVPVVFAPELNNVKSATLEKLHSKEFNAVAVMGQGQGDQRQVVTVEDVVAIGVSPINRREVTRGGNSQDDSLAGLEYLGYEELERSQYVEALKFTPKSNEGTLYGLQYGFGDRITAQFRGMDYHKRIVAVDAVVGPDGESLSFEFADIVT